MDLYYPRQSTPYVYKKFDPNAPRPALPSVGLRQTVLPAEGHRVYEVQPSPAPRPAPNNPSVPVAAGLGAAVVAPGYTSVALPYTPPSSGGVLEGFGSRVLDIAGRLASKVYATVGMALYPTALGQTSADEYKAVGLERYATGDNYFARMRSDSGVPADSTASVPAPADSSAAPPTPPAPKKPNDGKKPWGWKKRTAVGAAVLGATAMAVTSGIKLFTPIPDKEPSGMGISGTSLASADSLARQAAFGAPGLTEKELLEGTYGYKVRGWAFQSPVDAQFQKFPMNSPINRLMRKAPKEGAYIYQENPKWVPSFKIPTQASAPAPTIIYRDGGGDNSTTKEEEKPNGITIDGGEMSAQQKAAADEAIKAQTDWLLNGTPIPKQGN